MTDTDPPAGPPPGPDPTAALAREVDRLARRLADADLPGLAADLSALAARAAEAAVRAEGGVSEASAALFRRALDVAPPDAPWRTAAEQRLTAPRIPGG